MRKRVKIVALAVLLIAALVLTIRHFRHAPQFQGKTAAEWFQEYCRAERRYYTTPVRVRIGGSNAVVHALDSRSWQRDPAADGLRGLGTNAALFLAREICREDPSWAPRYRTLFAKLPRAVRAISPTPPANRIFVQRQAVAALELLGPDAAPAVPLLFTGLKNPDRYTRSEVMRILRTLPRNPDDTSPVLEDLARRGQFSAVLEIVEGLGLRTKTAVIALSEALTSGNTEAKLQALRQLSTFGSTASPAVPAIVATLTTTNSELRYCATSTLADIGPAARAAVPALQHLTNDTSSMVQHAAARALATIGTAESH
jgi:HEAT repeat protein